MIMGADAVTKVLANADSIMFYSYSAYVKHVRAISLLILCEENSFIVYWLKYATNSLIWLAERKSVHR